MCTIWELLSNRRHFFNLSPSLIMSSVHSAPPSTFVLGNIDEAQSVRSAVTSQRMSEEIYPNDSASNSGFGDKVNQRYRKKQIGNECILSQRRAQSIGIELDHDVSMPSLSTVRKNGDSTLYLFGSDEPHPRIRELAEEQNVIFIRTMAPNGVPFADKDIFFNIKAIQMDIADLGAVLEQKQYLRLLIPHSGFGVGSGFSMNAPKTWIAFKRALTRFVDAHSLSASFAMKWSEWENASVIHHEELTPEMRRIHALMEHQVERKRDEWRLRAHLAFKRQKHEISVCIF